MSFPAGSSKQIKPEVLVPESQTEEPDNISDILDLDEVDVVLEAKTRDFQDMKRMHKAQREKNAELTNRINQMESQIEIQKFEMKRVNTGVEKLRREIENKDAEIRRLKSIAEGFGVVPSTLSALPYVATWMAIVRNIGWKTARSFTPDQVLAIFNKRGFKLTITDFPDLVQTVFNGYPFHNIACGRGSPFERVLKHHMSSRNDAGEFKVSDVLNSYIPDRFMTPRVAAMYAGQLFRQSQDDLLDMFPEMPEHGMAIFCALHPNQKLPSADSIGTKAFNVTFRRIIRALAPICDRQIAPVIGKKRSRTEISQGASAE